MKPLGAVLVAMLATGTLSSGAPAAAESGVLEPRMHFLVEPTEVQIAYTVRQAFTPASVRVPGLTVAGWTFSNIAGVRELRLRLRAAKSQDVEWHTVQITDAKTKRVRTLEVGASRVVFAGAASDHPLEFERIEQQFGRQLGQRPYWGVRLFNESAQTVTVLRLLYAPKASGTARVALQPRYDPNWFANLGAWAASPDLALPGGASLVDAERVGFQVLPARGFSMAILGLSFKPLERCRTQGVQMDAWALQPVIEYRVGSGAPRLYPLPDTITAPLCP
jgi:hypothetical protein